MIMTSAIKYDLTSLVVTGRHHSSLTPAGGPNRINSRQEKIPNKTRSNILDNSDKYINCTVLTLTKTEHPTKYCLQR